jgi:hypothetical protein
MWNEAPCLTYSFEVGYSVSMFRFFFCIAGLDISLLFFISNFRLWNAVTLFISIFLQEGFYSPHLPFWALHVNVCLFFLQNMIQEINLSRKCVYFCLYMTPCSLLVVVWWEALLLMYWKRWHNTATALCLCLCAEL